MKQLLSIIIMLFSLSGCRSYIQVFEMASVDAEKEDEFYVFENDTLKLIYAFWHRDGIVSFSVYNKLDIPIYIDWKRSSLIYNSSKLNYWVDEERSRAAAFYGTKFYDGPVDAAFKEISLTTGVLHSSKVKLERVTFIPPQSLYYRTQFYLLKTGKDFQLNLSCEEQKVPLNSKPRKETSIYTETFIWNPPRYGSGIIWPYPLLSLLSKKLLWITNSFLLVFLKWTTGILNTRS